MDHKADNNPFKNHTVVFLSACSGDLFAGNVQHGYKDAHGKLVEQRGYNNVRTTLGWIQRNMGSEPLSSLVITGESAGSIGVQVWAPKMLSDLKYKKASVIADSYLGAFPQGFAGPVFKSLEVCHTGLLDSLPDLVARCDQGTLTVPEVFEAAIAAFPKVDFGSITSKYDPVQMHYYKLTGLSMGRPKDLSGEEFRSIAFAVIKRYQKYPNFGNFLLSSKWHVFTYQLYHDYGKYTNASFTNGVHGTVRHEFEDWMRHFAEHDHRAGNYCEHLGPKQIMAEDVGVLLDSCGGAELS